jgi:hypothetical protein
MAHRVSYPQTLAALLCPVHVFCCGPARPIPHALQQTLSAAAAYVASLWIDACRCT